MARYRDEIARVSAAVVRELRRAKQQYADMHSAHEAWGVLSEEMDEFWDEVKINPRKLDDQQREERVVRMRKELTQVAAMAMRAIVDLEL